MSREQQMSHSVSPPIPTSFFPFHIANSTNLWQRLLSVIFTSQTENNTTCDPLPSGMTGRGPNCSNEALRAKRGKRKLSFSLACMKNSFFLASAN